MTTTVKELAKLSGVSVRTLHFYDEIGLLKPAFVGRNGYRYYNEEQLLILQQILFFRELGFQLSEIQRILASDDFDKIETLLSHKGVLEQKVERTRLLVETIDKTISKLRGERSMTNEEMYHGFDSATQEGYERELVEKLGEPAQRHIDESKRRMKGWKKGEFERIGAEGDQVLRGLVAQINRGALASDPEVQKLIRLHYRWICHFWTPDQQTYKALGQGYVDHPDFRKFYEPYHPRLAEFLCKAMGLFAQNDLA